jgi:hypothetical protein
MTVVDEDLTISEDDVTLLNQWKAHKDSITWVNWAADVNTASSCSFDKKVFMWSAKDQSKPVG